MVNKLSIVLRACFTKQCDNGIIHLKLLNIAVNHYVQEVFSLIDHVVIFAKRTDARKSRF